MRAGTTARWGHLSLAAYVSTLVLALIILAMS